MAVHNLTENNLENVLNQGGLAVPSIAIINTDFPFSSFGDISLIADKSFIDPKIKSNKAYASDSYSIRYPSVSYFYNTKKIYEFGQEVKKELPYNGLYFYLEGGLEDLRRSFEVRLLYLKSTGKENDFVFLDNNKIDKYETLRGKDELFQTEEFKKFTKDIYDKLEPTEKIFKGLTNSGSRRYVPHNLENTVKIMIYSNLY